MSRHDEPIFDDELLEQRMERAIHSITGSQRVDKVTGDYILRRVFVITPFLIIRGFTLKCFPWLNLLIFR